jgi:hypothetical protein|tara:strand:+ start:2168 stop:2683 length:516 start_codon:yes stop_codon:yes gene_type:complete
MEVVAEFHLGGFVNKFVAGSLVMQPVASSSGDGGVAPSSASSAGAAAAASMTTTKTFPRPELIWATAEGAVGVIISLSEDQMTTLKALQQAIVDGAVIQGIGGFTHASWREFKSDRKEVPAKGMIDGDLIEQFLRLAPEKQDALAKVVAVKVRGVDASALIDLVERLSRLH